MSQDTAKNSSYDSSENESNDNLKITSRELNESAGDKYEKNAQVVMKDCKGDNHDHDYSKWLLLYEGAQFVQELLQSLVASLRVCYNWP